MSTSPNNRPPQVPRISQLMGSSGNAERRISTATTKWIYVKTARNEYISVDDNQFKTSATPFPFSIVRYVSKKPPVPIFKPESEIQVLFRFNTPHQYVGTEQDSVLKIVSAPNSYCIWTMQAYEGGFFSLSHPTKKTLIVKDGFLTLTDQEPGWEKMLTMELASDTPSSGAIPPPKPLSMISSINDDTSTRSAFPSWMGSPTMNNRTSVNMPSTAVGLPGSMGPSSIASKSSEPSMGPGAMPASAQSSSAMGLSSFTIGPGASSMGPNASSMGPNASSMGPNAPSAAAAASSPSTMMGRPNTPPGGPNAPGMGPGAGMIQRSAQAGPGPGTNPPTMGPSQGMMGPPQGMMGPPQGMMMMGPGGNRSGTPPAMMGGPPGQPPSGMMGPPPGMMGPPPGMMGPPPGMMGPPPGMMGPPPGMMGPPPGMMGPPPGMMGPGGLAGGPSANLNTPVSIEDQHGAYIMRTSSKGYVFSKFDIKKDPSRAAYFNVSLITDTKMWRTEMFDLNSGHKQKLVLQSCDSEQYIGVSHGKIVEARSIDHQVVWEFRKLPHNPLAFALIHVASNMTLASKKGKLALVTTATLDSSFTLYIAPSTQQALMLQNTPGQSFISKAMPYFSALSAVAGVATSAALILNFTKSSGSAAPPSTALQPSAPSASGRMEASDDSATSALPSSASGPDTAQHASSSAHPQAQLSNEPSLTTSSVPQDASSMSQAPSYAQQNFSSEAPYSVNPDAYPAPSSIHDHLYSAPDNFADQFDMASTTGAMYHDPSSLYQYPDSSYVNDTSFF